MLPRVTATACHSYVVQCIAPSFAYGGDVINSQFVGTTFFTTILTTIFGALNYFLSLRRRKVLLISFLACATCRLCSSMSLIICATMILAILPICFCHFDRIVSAIMLLFFYQSLTIFLIPIRLIATNVFFISFCICSHFLQSFFAVRNMIIHSASIVAFLALTHKTVMGFLGFIEFREWFFDIAVRTNLAIHRCLLIRRIGRMPGSAGGLGPGRLTCAS